jgi:hypothetical protein
MAQWGCSTDRVPPPAPARVPDRDERMMSNDLQNTRPLPTPVRDDLPPPPFDDVPLVSQEAPETPRFVDAYEHVGRPRIVVWVAHTPGDYYDDAATREIDFAAVETILTDWLSANGKVSVISPGSARQALSLQQAQDLNTGHPASTQEIGDKLRADVLVLVHTQVTHQSGSAAAMRLVADSSNLRGGESIGRAVVDVPPPLDKPQLNKYTRFVARKLMSDMTSAWTSTGNAPPPPPAQPAPGFNSNPSAPK